jgi:hypothetical protein
MTTTTVDRRLDDLNLELQGLVLVRALLELRGASAAELHAHDARTRRVRRELARLTWGQAAAGGE